VLVVLIFWWQMGNRLREEEPLAADVAAILPTNIPVLGPTEMPTPTLEPTPTTAPTAAEDIFLTHSVRSGETLLTIAGIYGTTVDEIQAANNLTDILIRVDDELIIPVARDEGQSAPLSSEFTYTIKDGDTVISIATLFGSTVQDILAVNGLSENDIIRPGDTLVVPVEDIPDDVLEAGDGAETAPVEASEVPENSGDGGEEGAIYIEPRLTGPANRAVIPREDPVLLRWVSVDLLAPNEWYVLQIYPTEGAVQPVPTVWTKGTSHRLDAELAPPEGRSASYAWQVSVARVLPQPDGSRQLEAASPPSLVRTFTWE